MFLSSYEIKIDKKGRVSVPATFRSHLSSMGYNGFISYPSFNHSALEACSQDRIEKLSSTIDTLNPFEEKRDYFASSILSECENLQFDTEGRVSFSNKLLNHAKIKNIELYSQINKELNKNVIKSDRKKIENILGVTIEKEKFKRGYYC